MPYIKQDDRKLFDIEDIQAPFNAGELNYLISSIINDYIDADGISYSVLNKVIGVLECCKLEVYRRIVTPYEEAKMEENGDVFNCVDMIKKGK